MDQIVKPLIEKASQYIDNQKYLKEIEQVYEYSKRKHEGQFRKSGEPYIIHPVKVAIILTEYNSGPKTLSAALLHDVLEDTDTTYEEIAEIFGEEIAIIVSGVTKITQYNFISEEKALADNHRKMLLAMIQDIRVILVKLADRLHNMRTLEFMDDSKKKQKCIETMEIFIPLAHRLGIYRLKAELEDICYKNLDHQQYHLIAKNLEDTKVQREKDLCNIVGDITKYLSEEKIDFTIKGRIKNIYSIGKKMKSKDKTFNEIFDLSALRVMVNTIEDCYKVLGIIHAHFKPLPRRFKDYISIPKTNLYQSLHTTILTKKGKIFEIQIRTEFMDRVAEIGIAAHWSYKEGKSSKEEQKEIANSYKWLGSMIEQVKSKDLVSDHDFLDSIKEELTANVFVFTPNGDVHMLPLGSTPIDFAYRIHTGVGEMCVGALVNNKMVPLDLKLQTGDICSIKTSKISRGPSEDWLKIARSSHAKAKIRTFLNRKNRDNFIEYGRRKLQELIGEEKIDLKITDKMIEEKFNSNEIKDLETLYLSIGRKVISPKGTINKLTGQIDSKFDEIKIIENVNKHTENSTNVHGIIVEGLENPKLKLSNCCNPVPGDPIIGTVTKGKGVVIHRDNCKNVIGADEKRFLNVSWSKSVTNYRYKVTLKVFTLINPTLLVKIVNLVTANDVVLSKINTSINKNGDSVIKMDLEVKNRNQVAKTILNIRGLPDIIDVVRIGR